MAFILTEQRHDEVSRGGAFLRYREYLRSLRERFPAKAYGLATSDWYFSFEDHRSPHDARLDSLMIGEKASPASGSGEPISLLIRLLSAYHDGYIELHYIDVGRYELALGPDSSAVGFGHRDWRYDEFRLSPGGRVEHEIEWWGSSQTARWLIEAADVEHRWVPRTATSVHDPA